MAMSSMFDFLHCDFQLTSECQNCHVEGLWWIIEKSVAATLLSPWLTCEL